jgi:hypothetical protein
MESESHGDLPTASAVTVEPTESTESEDTSDLEKDLKDLEKELDKSD